MTAIRITAGPFAFTARLEVDRAPKSCAWFQGLLPYRNKVIHSRWSGEAVWIPLGEFDTGLAFGKLVPWGGAQDIVFEI